MASVDLYRRALDLIVAMLLRDLKPAEHAVTTMLNTRSAIGDDPQVWQEAAIDLYARTAVSAVKHARRCAWAASVLFLEDQARQQFGGSSVLPAEPDYDVKVLRDAVRRAGGPLNSELTHQRLREALTRHVEMAARQTVRAAVDNKPGEQLSKHTEEDGEPLTRSEIRWLEAQAKAREAEEPQTRQEHDERLYQARLTLSAASIDYPTSQTPSTAPLRAPFAWARMIQATADKPACGFCIMCASRGPVYSSKEKALFKRKTLMQRYHDHCRCITVPVFTSKKWAGKDDYEKLSAIYDKVVKDQGLTGAQARTALDEWSRGNRSTEEKMSRAQRAKRVAQAAQREGWEILAEDIHPRPATDEERAIATQVQDALQALPPFLEELPDLSEIKVTAADMLQHWDGAESARKGGHSPIAEVVGKTHVPGWWSINDYAKATRETLREPQFVQPIDGAVSWVFGRVVDGVLMSVTVNTNSRKVTHAYPVVGAGVTRLLKERLVCATFYPGIVGKWRHVRSA